MGLKSESTNCQKCTNGVVVVVAETPTGKYKNIHFCSFCQFGKTFLVTKYNRGKRSRDRWSNSYNVSPFLESFVRLHSFLCKSSFVSVVHGKKIIGWFAKKKFVRWDTLANSLNPIIVYSVRLVLLKQNFVKKTEEFKNTLISSRNLISQRMTKLRQFVDNYSQTYLHAKVF